METTMNLVKSVSVFSKLANVNRSVKNDNSENKNKIRLTKDNIQTLAKELFEDYLDYLKQLNESGNAGILSASNEAVMELLSTCLRRSFNEKVMVSARFDQLEKYSKVCVNRFRYILSKYDTSDRAIQEAIIRVVEIHMEVVDRKVAQMEVGLWN